MMVEIVEFKTCINELKPCGRMGKCSKHVQIRNQDHAVYEGLFSHHFLLCLMFIVLGVKPRVLFVLRTLSQSQSTVLPAVLLLAKSAHFRGTAGKWHRPHGIWILDDSAVVTCVLIRTCCEVTLVDSYTGVGLSVGELCFNGEQKLISLYLKANFNSKIFST